MYDISQVHDIPSVDGGSFGVSRCFQDKRYKNRELQIMKDRLMGLALRRGYVT